MAQSDREKAVIAAFYDTMQKLVGSEKDLNGLHVKGIAQMQKSMNETEVNTKKIKQQTLAVKASLEATLDDNVTKIKSIKLNEKLIKLRNRNALEQIREQGEQVRRNIKLRAGNEKFSASLALASKSLTGGFGFQAGISTTIQGFAQLTKKFNNLKYATEDLSKSHKRTAKLKEERDQAIVNQLFGTGTQQQTDDAEEDYKTSQQKTARNLSSAVDAEHGKGIEQKGMKGIFSKLSGLGEFLSKKAVPIGIGMGVAGILMSVIVKSFSASPLFAQMMKMMKFMVTLILMPIGTFFGALLRPILIMLLRKFIIPFYSNWMPKMMAWGTALGNWLSGKGGDEEIRITPDFDDDFETNPWYEMTTEELLAAISKALSKSHTKSYEDSTDGGDEGDDGDDGGRDNRGAIDGGIFKAANADDGTLGSLTPKELKELQDKNAEQAKKDADLMGIAEETSTGELGDKTYQEHAEGKVIGSFGTMAGDGIKKTESDYQQAREEIAKLEKAELDRKKILANDQAILDAKLAKIERDKHVRQAAEKAAERAAAVAKTLARSNSIFAAQKSNSELGLGQYSSANNGQTGITPERVDSINPNNGKTTRIHNAGISEGAYEKASKPKGHVNLSSSNKSNLKPETIALFKSMGIAGYAQGFDGMINSPTMFLAGESGAEHVKVTPNGQGGGGSNITVNIQNMNAGDDDLRKLKKTILEVIQQSTNNRGRL